MKRRTKRYYIIAIDSYDGDTTSRDQAAFSETDGEKAAALYAVVAVDPQGARVVDDGYGDRSEAKKAWPEAL